MKQLLEKSFPCQQRSGGHMQVIFRRNGFRRAEIPMLNTRLIKYFYATLFAAGISNVNATPICKSITHFFVFSCLLFFLVLPLTINTWEFALGLYSDNDGVPGSPLFMQT